MLTSDDGKQPGSDSSNSPCLSVQEYFDLTPCNSGLVAILSAHTSLQLTFALSEKTCVCLATEDKQDSRGRLKTWAVVFCAAAVWLVISEKLLATPCQGRGGGSASLIPSWPFRLFLGHEMLTPFKSPLSSKAIVMISVQENTLSRIH